MGEPLVFFVGMYALGLMLGVLGMLLRFADTTEPLPPHTRMRLYLLALVLWPMSIVGMAGWAVWSIGGWLLWLLRYAVTGKR